LFGIGSALGPAGQFVFEVRDPAKQAWLGWNRAGSFKRVDLGGGNSGNTSRCRNANWNGLGAFSPLFHSSSPNRTSR